MNLIEKPITSISKIKELIPHREPMIMVDKLIYIDEKLCKTELTVLRHNLFVSDALFQESGILEHMAQSAALQTGFHNIKNSAKPKVGFIASVNSMIIMGLPSIGETICTEINTLFSSEGIRKIKGNCFVEGKSIANATMTLVLDNSEG